MGKKRISIGTWAYCVGPYMQNPIPFAEVVKGLKKLGFDGLELGAFFSHPNPENHPTLESRKALKNHVESNGLVFSGIATDMWNYPGHESHLADATDGGEHYLSMVRKNLEFTRDLGIDLFRVDTVQEPDILSNGFDKNQAMDNVVKTWQKVCKMAADMGINVTWEFEPGFVFNRPSDIVTIVNAVGEKNFGAMYDTCHAYMCAVAGSRHSGGEVEASPDGMLDLARKLRGKINAIQIIDCDGELNEHKTSTHKVFGTPGTKIDFPPVLQELSANSGCPHDWWTIDLCFEDGAWPKTEACKKAADELNAMVNGNGAAPAAPAKAASKPARKAKAKSKPKAKAKAKPKAKPKAKAKAAKKKAKKGRK
ncbi:MAG: sugar phosphate isomerase/epimerase [Planctomycetaceae bacterium]|nr:sugar phosphate isomerase/epimerase [Planctomycetaceae bacterium]